MWVLLLGLWIRNFFFLNLLIFQLLSPISLLSSSLHSKTLISVDTEFGDDEEKKEQEEK